MQEIRDQDRPSAVFRPRSARVKVLHLITRLIVGGAQDNTLMTAARHDRDRYIVHVAGNPSGEWAGRAAEVADTFHPLPNLVNPISPRRDTAALADILRLIRRERYHVVHTHSSKAGMLGRLAARIAGVPAIVHTMHGPGIHDFMPPVQRRIYVTAERLAARCTDALIAVSDSNRRQAMTMFGVPAARTKTIYSGIDLSKLDRAWDVERARADIALPAAWQIVLFVGRLDDAKAPHLLIEAFAKVLRVLPATALVLVGSGDHEAGMRRQIAELGIGDHVRFMGTRDDVPAFLGLADVFALSSLWEGVGRAMTEAMLLGVPVVAPEIYGIPEIIRHDETGLLYPRGDTGALASRVVDLLTRPDHAKRLGDEGRRLTRRLFDGDTMVRAIEGIYEELLAEA